VNNGIINLDRNKMPDRHKIYQIGLSSFVIFDPKGWIATEQKSLIITVVLLMLFAVVPFLMMAFLFAWKYRAGNKAKYTPLVDATICMVRIAMHNHINHRGDHLEEYP
jgi:hypothetical protein